MQHDFDEATSTCRRCGLGKALLLNIGNPPCGTFQTVPPDDTTPCAIVET